MLFFSSRWFYKSLSMLFFFGRNVYMRNVLSQTLRLWGTVRRASLSSCWLLPPADYLAWWTRHCSVLHNVLTHRSMTFNAAMFSQKTHETDAHASLSVSGRYGRIRSHSRDHTSGLFIRTMLGQYRQIRLTQVVIRPDRLSRYGRINTDCVVIRPYKYNDTDK